MITFKQFIAEIDYDDEVYSKQASDHVMNFDVDDSWEPLMKIDGNPIVWKRVAMEYRVLMLDRVSNKSMLRLELREKTVKVPGGVLIGIVTDSISSKKEYRGQGHALRIYEALIDNGQVLFSSNAQTTGSRKLWEQLVKRKFEQAFVLAEGAAARWYIRRFGDEKLKATDVLLKGSYEQMNDEAYADSETRWVIVPGNVNAFKNGALQLDAKVGK